MLLIVIVVASIFIFFTSATSFSIIEDQNDEITDEKFDFTCGQVFFSHEAVQRAAQAGRKALANSRHHPIPFNAPFYPKNLDLVIWPIKETGEMFTAKNGSPGIYYIVMNWLGDVKDVVAKTMISQYIKCSKKSRSLPDPPIFMQDETNGYDCGSDHFEDENLSHLAMIASNKIKKDYRVYAKHKFGQDNSDVELFIWPIQMHKKYEAKKWNRNTYFFVLSLHGEVKYVMVKLINSNLYRCPRVKLPEKLPGNDEEESEEEPGYQCGFYFFGMKYLRRSSNIAEKPLLISYKRKYPMPYSKTPFYTEVLLYPIFPGDRLYTRGKVWKHFVVLMIKTYQVIGVVAQTHNGYKLCDQRFRSQETIIESGNFICDGEEFQHDHLLATANLASERMGKKILKYPAKYDGPEFDITGPYITWPLIQNGFYKKAAGKYRVVLNKHFNIAGVIEMSNEVFHKCTRAHDGSIPGGQTPGKSITEIPGAYRLDMM